MLSNITINDYMDTIPAVPKVVKECVNLLNSGDLVGAADKANEDRALIYYFKNIVNKPIFGFRDEIKNVRQIFGVLGLSKAKQLIYGYYILLILPKKWKVFDFSNASFQEFQARLIFNWGKIVKSLDNDNDDELIQVISIIPASLVVCEMLFLDVNDTVKLLKEKKQMSYESILYKMTDRTLFEIASLIAKKWDFSDDTISLIKKVGNSKGVDFGENALSVTYLKLLIIYEMSRPEMVHSGLNDLFDLELVFDDEITNNFYKIIQADG